MSMTEYVARHLARLIRERNLAIENLTKEQFVEALTQAIKSGDFRRLVRVDNQSQAVVYIPYENQQKLEARINQLEEKLWELGINPDTI